MPRTMFPLPPLEPPFQSNATGQSRGLVALGCIHLASTILGTDTAEQAAREILCIKCTLALLFKRA